jgi:hypothetical protein
MCQSWPGRSTRKKPGRRRRRSGRWRCKSRSWRITRCARLRLTGRPSSRLVSAATMRLPSVGFCLATSTIARSTGPDTGRGPGSLLRVGVR